jgi:hypothetical protein
MSYYGPTTTREVGNTRRTPVWLVAFRLVASALSRQSRQLWARFSSPRFGRSSLERFASRAASLVMAIVLAALAARGEVANAASRPSGAKSSARLSLATQAVSAKAGSSRALAVKSFAEKSPLTKSPIAKSSPVESPVAKSPVVSPLVAKSSAAKTASAKRYGGRVQRDASGRWIVDGALIGLATVNIPGGQDAVFDTTVPAGLTPLELRGHYVIPASSTESWLEVGISGGTPQRVNSTKGRTFSVPTLLGSRGALNATDQSGDANDSVAGSTASDAASDAASVAASSADGAANTDYVEFTARTKVNATCPDYQPSQLDKLQLVVGGSAEAPVMLADFFPPFLDRLVVRVEATMSKSKAIDENVAQAVLRLTTFAAQRWPSARVIVSSKALAMTPYDRQVAFRVASKSSVGLEELDGETTLVLSGPKSRMANLAEFLSSPALETAFVSSLMTNGQSPSVLELGHVLTIGDLRGRALVGKGFGSVEQVVTVTQSQLGGQADSIAVKVTGVAQVAGAGRLVVQLRANEQVLATKRVLNDEPFVLKGMISRSTLTRDNVIVVRASELSSGTAAAEKLALSPGVLGVNTANGSGVCGLGRPEVTLQLDPGSQFAATMGRGLPAGFDRFPQAFVNGFDVRFASLGLGELQAGSDVVQLLQSLSAPRLSPKVYGPKRSHAPTRPMIYVGPPSAELTKLDAPIVPEKRSAANVQPISVLQGFAATGDDHLVLVTNGPASDLASTLVAVQADPRGWRSLRGDVVVRQNGRIRNVRVRTSTGNGQEKRPVVLHSRVGYALRVGFGMGTAFALFGVLVARLFGRKHA